MPSSPSSASLLAAALAHHRAGRLKEAEALYRQLLTSEPNHPDALHLLGVLARQTGHLDASAQLIGQAVALRPKTAVYLSNLGVTLLQQKKLPAALDAFNRALEADPQLAEAHCNLGDVLREMGKLDEAVAACRRAIELNPAMAEAHNNLGNALKAKGDFDAAVAAYEAAIRQGGQTPTLSYNLASAESARGRHDIALSLLRRVVRETPGFSEAQVLLGNTLGSLGQWQEARDAYDAALAARPDDATAANNLGNSLRELGRIQEAVAAYRRAIAARPIALHHHNLGLALLEVGDVDGAVDAFSTALPLEGDNPAFLNSLGTAWKDAGKLDWAIECYEASLSVRLDPAVQSNLVYVRYFREQDDADSIRAEQRRWSERYELPLRSVTPPVPRLPARDQRLLRIGYVSADFRDHVVGLNLLPLFPEHDRQRFEIYCYSNVAKPDVITERFKNACDQWRDIAKLSDETVAKVIRDDRIDILVDLSLHMSGNRLPVFARRPAPVQISFAGYPADTGLRAIGYRLSDPYLDPPSEMAPVDRGVLHLPHSFWCYDPEAMTGSLSPRPQVPPLPALKAGHVTFGCLSNFSKLNEGVLRLWGSILASIDQSRLILLTPTQAGRQRVRTQLASSGVGPERIEFVGRMTRADYFATYQRIDIGLDPFPYAGHTTSLDSLWMGVPVVTLAGKMAVGRAGVSQLSNLGLGQLIAADADQYLQIALALCQNLPALAEMRQGLREQMLRSPLTDAAAFARGVEAAFLEAWRRESGDDAAAS